MRRLLSVSAVLLATAAPALAQGGMNMGAPAGGRLAIAPSTRGHTIMEVSTGVRGAAPMKVTIDYGQPHARGRAVEGGLIPSTEVWRTGANAATSLTTDVTLKIGTLTVPKGTYTLFSFYTPSAGMQLVVNKQTGQWGTEYKPDMDLGRTQMTTKTLAESRDAFTIVLEPAAAGSGPAMATLRLTWGKSEWSVPVTVVP